MHRKMIYSEMNINQEIITPLNTLLEAMKMKLII